MFGVSTRTIHRALNGNKDGGGCDQTTNPLTSTTVDALNGDKSTTTTHQGGV